MLLSFPMILLQGLPDGLAVEFLSEGGSENGYGDDDEFMEDEDNVEFVRKGVSYVKKDPREESESSELFEHKLNPQTVEMLKALERELRAKGN